MTYLHLLMTKYAYISGDTQCRKTKETKIFYGAFLLPFGTST